MVQWGGMPPRALLWDDVIEIRNRPELHGSGGGGGVGERVVVEGCWGGVTIDNYYDRSGPRSAGLSE